MRRLTMTFIAAIMTAQAAYAQEAVQNAATDGDKLKPVRQYSLITKLLVNILTTQHYARKFLDDAVSKDLFNKYLKTLDPNKLYFTQKDIGGFSAHETTLDDEIFRDDIQFAYDTYKSLLAKVKARNEFAKLELAKGFNFKTRESIEIDRSKGPWAPDEAALNEAWRKRLKNEILTYRLMKRTQELELKEPTATDTARAAASAQSQKSPEERVVKRLDSYLKYLEGNESMDILAMYLGSMAAVYDPHSSYMSPRDEADFNIHMSLQLVGIGAVLSSEDGYTKVEKLMPGGPAERDGRLKPNDKIIAVAQGDTGEPVDVIDMPLNKVVDMIRGKKNSKVRLTVISGIKGGPEMPCELEFIRDVVSLKDSEATGDVRTITTPSGAQRTVGVLRLPSFYYDFTGAGNGNEVKSTTVDVRRILRDFNSKNVEGIVFDLRSDGGGSLREAIDTTGLFIKSGPVVQTKDYTGNVTVESDSDADCVFSKPMIVLVNRLSASASEIFAGAIQDYGRGVIVGEKKTHGKGTVQTVLDLQRVMNMLKLNFKAGSVKVTNAKFYRVSGGSTQNKGVEPDITFDSFTDYMEFGESELEHALPWDKIDPVPYTCAMSRDTIQKLQDSSVARRGIDPQFKKLKSSIDSFKKIKERKTISLNEEERWNEYLAEKKAADEQDNLFKSINGDEENTITPSMTTGGGDKKPDATKKNPDDKDTKKANDLFMKEGLNILGDLLDNAS